MSPTWLRILIPRLSIPKGIGPGDACCAKWRGTARTPIRNPIRKQRGEDAALQVIAHMQQGRVVSLDSETALTAAKLGIAHRLPLADSVILATARIHGATVWTQDSDFKGLQGVRYIPKSAS